MVKSGYLMIHLTEASPGQNNKKAIKMSQFEANFYVTALFLQRMFRRSSAQEQGNTG